MINGVINPFRSTKAEKRKLVAKNNEVQSSYQHKEKTRARGNTRDERSAMIMEEGGAVLMNSINHSFESFDSCGQTFNTILRLCVKTLSQSQYLFLRRFFFSFRSSVT